MPDLDVDQLIKSLDNADNEYILDIDFNTLNQQKKQVINNLSITNILQTSLISKLRWYRYIDELPDIKYGKFIRWINVTSDVINLTAGGNICEIKVEDTGIIIVCKNFQNKFFQLNMRDCLIFQKLSKQEMVLFAALKYIR